MEFLDSLMLEENREAQDGLYRIGGGKYYYCYCGEVRGFLWESTIIIMENMLGLVFRELWIGEESNKVPYGNVINNRNQGDHA